MNGVAGIPSAAAPSAAAPAAPAAAATTAPPTGWSTTVKALHWTILLGVLVEVPAGYLMSFTYGPSFRDTHILSLHNLLSQIHHTTGFLILAAGCAWLGVRLRAARPPLPAMMPSWQRWLARGVQWSLLALLLLIPWSGWTALSALEDSARFGPTHLWFFGTDRLLPRIWRPLAANDPAGYGRFARLHGVLLRIGLGLLCVHVGSALWHQFARRDGILGRMWPRPGLEGEQ